MSTGTLGGPWPSGAVRGTDGVLVIGGVPVTELAREHGTPLWVVDETDLRARCRAFRSAFPGFDVLYASKAWCTVGILRIVAEEGLGIDVATEGELHTAIVAGADPATIVLHGSNKSRRELERAVDAGVGRIVVDSIDELDRLESVAAERDAIVSVWLRITPGIDAHTHEYVRTGHDDTKFGLSLALGIADVAVRRALALPHLVVRGLHAHVGSQITTADAFVANAEVLVDLAARWRDELGLLVDELDLGGGMGVAHGEEDAALDLDATGAALSATIARRCAEHGLAVPRLVVEPGRAIVGPTTVTLYEVGTVKDLPGLTTWVGVDGGMSDNVRPALYGAVHAVTLAGRRSEAPPHPVTVVGKHCESGDLVRAGVALPCDLAVGDLIAVAATGAYTEAMSSNYNRVPRPAAVLVRDGRTRPLLRRETLDDLVARDVLPDD